MPKPKDENLIFLDEESIKNNKPGPPTKISIEFRPRTNKLLVYNIK